MEKEIVFVLLDDFADWEAAFLAPALRAGTMPGRPASYGVKYMTPDGRPVRSIGGLRAAADCDASALPEACAGLILVGGMQWQSEAAQRIVPLVGEALARGIVVGAICNAVSFMAAHGFLNGVRHTGNTLGMPVSYTHLDVYKRQVQLTAENLPLYRRIIETYEGHELEERDGRIYICLLYTSPSRRAYSPRPRWLRSA